MKKETVVIGMIVLLIFGGSFLVRSCADRSGVPPQINTDAEIERIISLAPSLTETIFLLGLEKKLIGVTIFCTYPEGAKNIQKIGGYSTPDFERIVLLKPDIILMVTEHKKAGFEEKFAKLGIRTLFTAAGNVEDIVSSIRTVASVCGAEEKGDNTVEEFRKRIAAIEKNRTNPKPVILITVGKNMGTNGLESVFAAGQNTFYNDLITIAGGVNGCPKSPQLYVNLSGESLIMNSPDIVIDMVPGASDGEVEKIQETWHKIPGFKAQVAVLRGEYESRPGPSFIKTLDDIEQEVKKWQSSTR